MAPKDDKKVLFQKGFHLPGKGLCMVEFTTDDDEALLISVKEVTTGKSDSLKYNKTEASDILKQYGDHEAVAKCIQFKQGHQLVLIPKEK